MLVADVDRKSGQIAAGDLPLVVLFGENSPDEAPDRSPVREDAHGVGASPYLVIEALLGVVRPDLRPMRHEERGEGENLWPRLFQHYGGLGEAFVEHTQNARMLCVDLLRRGLLVDRPDHGRLPGLGPAGDFGDQVGHEVGAAALPRGPGEDRGDGVLQSLMSVGGYQLNHAEASRRQCYPRRIDPSRPA